VHKSTCCLISTPVKAAWHSAASHVREVSKNMLASVKALVLPVVVSQLLAMQAMQSMQPTAGHAVTFEHQLHHWKQWNRHLSLHCQPRALSVKNMLALSQVLSCGTIPKGQLKRICICCPQQCIG
jgi:hypothetical protein